MRSPGRTIAIVGAGFSGTVLAVNLLRRASGQPTRIVLIESRAQVGRGVAYREDSQPHLLNVPAARMSAESRDPLQFAHFAQARDASYRPDQFLPRRLYGEYLQALLQSAAQSAPPHVRLERIHARADAVHRIDPTGPYLVSLSNQQRILADDVVLACGDPPPAIPAWAAAIAGHSAYVCDPFGDRALRPAAQRVLLVGSGLTMADVAIASASLNPGIQIHAISRHGLLPAAQTLSAPVAVSGDLLSHLPSQGALTARWLLRAFRALLSQVLAQRGDWRDAINSARQAAPQVWHRLAYSERARFLRHLRTYWDVHRHRMPPATEQRLQAMRQTGQLQLHAGHLCSMVAEGEQIRVQWRVRGSRSIQSLLVDQVVNCSGTDRRLTHTRDGLLRSLMAEGLAVADPLGLGLRTGEHGALLDRKGSTGQRLFYLGPMLRAQHWEATAVGELRALAESLARALMRVSVSKAAPGVAPASRLDQLALKQGTAALRVAHRRVDGTV
jgi:uncharacterized NAD(P)/FAD-binding protein YdhS